MALCEGCWRLPMHDLDKLPCPDCTRLRKKPVMENKIKVDNPK